ncbi:PIG-X [Dipodascopsis uninucleata]
MSSIRQRHTFIVHEQFRDTADTLKLNHEQLSMSDVPATRHDRLIIDENLLKEKELLRGIKRLRIEIVSPENYAHASPFERSVVHGTHIYVSANEAVQWKQLCEWIKSAINQDIDCIGQESFVELPFAFYLYSAVTDKRQILAYTSSTYDKVIGEVDKVLLADAETADYMSFALDRGTDDVKFKNKLITEAYWSQGNWTKTILAGNNEHRVEVGLLGKLNDEDDGDQTFGGILAVIGENEQFVPTLFDFTPRHRKLGLSATYNPDFRLPYGLHPKHLTVIHGDLSPPLKKFIIPDDEEYGDFAGMEMGGECKLYAYYTLPNFIFVDKYQISDLAESKSSAVKRVVGIWGETDLEIPVWMVDKWGSTMLLELEQPGPALVPFLGQTINLEIPMHSRYEMPDWKIKSVTHPMPWPIVFWACNVSSESEMVSGPFDSKSLGIESFFPDGTALYYFLPNMTISNTIDKSYLITNLRIPVVPLEAYQYVEPYTVIAIVLGCIWIFYKAFLGYRRDGGISKSRKGVPPSAEKNEKKGPKEE